MNPGPACTILKRYGVCLVVDVHVSTVSPAQQSHSKTKDHPGGRGNSHSPPPPWWSSQPWFPHLLPLCVYHPRIILYRWDLLSQQGYVSDSKSYHLHAWRLSCSTTKQQGFQRSLDSQQPLGDPQQTECTTTGDFTSLTGLQD